jgi:hypothetical protein
MSLFEYSRFAPMRGALAAVALAFVFAAWSLVSAFRAPPAPPVATHPAVVLNLKTSPLPKAVNVDAAVESDLFSPDREAPAQAFRMPGEPPPHAAAAVVASVTKPTVLGTAVAPNGFSFATAELGVAGPRIIREGDKLGDFTVKTIERGRVVFLASDGTRFDIAATPAPNTQESSNASIDQAPVAADSGFRSFFARGAGRGRGGRARRDSIPPG